MAETATTTSSWTATTRTERRSAFDEELEGLAEVRDLGVGLLLARLQRLLAPVDPHDRDLLLQAGLDVVVVALGHVHPALLGPDAPLALVEVRRVGLVGADLLRGDHEVEVDRHVAPRLAEELVVDVGDQPDLDLLLELLQRRVGLLERRPALDRVGQEARPGGLELPADVLGDAHRGAAQDLGVELVGARHDLALDGEEALDDVVAVDLDAVARRLSGEGVVGAALPVDQRAVDVEGDEGDVLGDGHVRRGIMPIPPGRRPAGRALECPPLMDLLEYQGKQLFARQGIPVPTGKPATTVDEAVAVAGEIGYPCVVKAQVQIGGRGKLGGIKVANDESEAREHATNILGMDIKGLTVHEVWVEQASQIDA